MHFDAAFRLSIADAVAFFAQSILFGSLLSLLIAIREPFSRRLNFKSVMDIILFSSGGIVLLYVWLFMTGNGFASHLLNHLYLPFLYTTGPATYFGYYAVVDPAFQFRRIYLVTFAPALVVLLVVTLGILIAPALYAHQPMDYFAGKPITALEYLAVGGGLYNLFFYLPLFTTASLLFRFRALRTKFAALVLVLSNITLSGVVVLYLVAFIYRESFWLYLGVTILAYLNILYEIARRYNPELFEQIKEAMATPKIKRLTGLDLRQLHFELIELMTEDKLYLDEKLTLARLAEELDIRPHQLSEFLNKYMQTNFNRFVNQFRIEKAVKRLVENPELNILEVAFECGFSSKTAFNRAFQTLKGTSPGRYVEKKRVEWRTGE